MDWSWLDCILWNNFNDWLSKHDQLCWVCRGVPNLWKKLKDRSRKRSIQVFRRDHNRFCNRQLSDHSRGRKQALYERVQCIDRNSNFSQVDMEWPNAKPDQHIQHSQLW